VAQRARGREDIVARGFELLPQPVQIDAEQLSLPLAHLTGVDHGLDVGAVHTPRSVTDEDPDQRDIVSNCMEGTFSKMPAYGSPVRLISSPPIPALR
jgi:hypothetical protein